MGVYGKVFDLCCTSGVAGSIWKNILYTRGAFDLPTHHSRYIHTPISIYTHILHMCVLPVFRGAKQIQDDEVEMVIRSGMCGLSTSDT